MTSKARIAEDDLLGTVVDSTMHARDGDFDAGRAHCGKHVGGRVVLTDPVHDLRRSVAEEEAHVLVCLVRKRIAVVILHSVDGSESVEVELDPRALALPLCCPRLACIVP